MSDSVEVDCSLIIRGDNDRKRFDHKELSLLAQSIKKDGLVQPITIRPLAKPHDGYMYEIVCGERRFRAVSQVLGNATIRAFIREMSDETASSIMLSENTSRSDLNPMSLAHALQKRIDQFGWSVDQLSEVSGLSAKMIKRRLMLIKLTPALQDMVTSGNLPVSQFENQSLLHGELMSRLDTNRQTLAIRYLNTGPKIEAFRRYVSKLETEQNQASLFNLTTFYLQATQAKTEAPQPIWGKDAVVGTPTNPNYLGLVEGAKDLSIGAIIETFIESLLALNEIEEATAVGSLYQILVTGRKVALASSTVSGGSL